LKIYGVLDNRNTNNHHIRDTNLLLELEYWWCSVNW